MRKGGSGQSNECSRGSRKDRSSDKDWEDICEDLYEQDKVWRVRSSMTKLWTGVRDPRRTAVSLQGAQERAVKSSSGHWYVIGRLIVFDRLRSISRPFDNVQSFETGIHPLYSIVSFRSLLGLHQKTLVSTLTSSKSLRRGWKIKVEDLKT